MNQLEISSGIAITCEKGIAKADSRSDRESADGAIAIAQGENAVAIVELKSETDFSAKAADFLSLTQQLADLVLAEGGGYRYSGSSYR